MRTSPLPKPLDTQLPEDVTMNDKKQQEASFSHPVAEKK